MNQPRCEICGREFALDRQQPDRVLCELCAATLGLAPDGSEPEEDE